VKTTFVRGVLCFALALGLGIQFGRHQTAKAATFSTLTPSGADELDGSNGPGDYWFSGLYECNSGGGSTGEPHITLDSTPAFDQFIKPACPIVHTDFSVELCQLPSGTPYVSGTMRRRDGTVVPVTLTRTYPGSYYFKYVSDTPMASTPVFFDVTSNGRMTSVVLFYSCAGTNVPPSSECSHSLLRSGTGSGVGWPCPPATMLVPLNAVNTGPTCEPQQTEAQRFGIVVEEVRGCILHATYQLFAVFADGTQQLMTSNYQPDYNIEFDSQCVLPQEPVAVRVVANGSPGGVAFVEAHSYKCCNCTQ